MELALSLGDASKPSFIDNLPAKPSTAGLDFRVGLGFNAVSKEGEDDAPPPPLQLDLLPFSPIPRNNPAASQFRLPWLTEALGSSEVEPADGPARGVDVNQFPASGDDADDGAAHSSPNSAMSSFQMEFGISSGSGGRSKRGLEEEEEDEKDGSRGGTDDDENGSTRKKLRLSKDQSAFLEESFKEHSTLNPKQKLELAKQLNLRPRQVEVWFQNRRARTKLKQTEIDCEYLKRCCETLTEENRRLQKELQELRALKTSQPFYMQLPATTLTMCPSCERVATTSSASAVSVSASASAAAAASSSSAATNSSAATLPLLGKASARAFPFAGAGEIHVRKAA